MWRETGVDFCILYSRELAGVIRLFLGVIRLALGCHMSYNTNGHCDPNQLVVVNLE